MKRTLLALGAIGITLTLATGAWAGSRYIITGPSQIKPGSITSENIRNGAVSFGDLSLDAKDKLHGQRGPQGQTGPQGTQGAQGPQGQAVNYEVDNGTSWTLTDQPNALPDGNAGYEDAGVVVDLGPASSFDGITFTGTGNLVDNLWVTDGSEAYTPGEHALSGTPDFSFYNDNGNGTWAAQDAKAAPHGQSASNADIATAYAGYEVYAWVGVTGDGTSSSTGHIATVNGTPVNADVTVDGTTAAAR